MLTATLSSKGQVVVPARLRRNLKLRAGDTIVFTEEPGRVVLQRRESWDELSERFHSWIKPGTPPLEDVHGFYDQREPRL